MINETAIQQMKKGVKIVNTSRGGPIDTEALIDGIKNETIGAACLDVYEEEGDLFYEDFSGHIIQDDKLVRLIAMPNVIVTSHQAFLTNEALDNIANTTVSNIRKFFAGEPSPETEVCYGCGRQQDCSKERNKKCF
jgi:D-lactate dehydrogenase